MLEPLHLFAMNRCKYKQIRLKDGGLPTKKAKSL